MPVAGESEKAKSQTGEAYRVLRDAIVAGDMAPGLRLSPAELSARFDLGPTPIREALSRLGAEHLVIAYEQRGFRVAPLSSAELKELLALRLGFEREAMFRSMREGGVEWEAGIVAAFHLLSRSTPPHPGQAPAALADWSQRHDDFHHAILLGAKAPWLMRFHQRTVEQIERYRLAILKRSREASTRTTAGAAAEARLDRILSHADHAALRDAVLARDEAAADARLTAHIGETMDIFVTMFDAFETESARPKVAVQQQVF